MRLREGEPGLSELAPERGRLTDADPVGWIIPAADRMEPEASSGR